MSLKRLMARVATHRDAITKARMAGITWGEIGDRLGVSSAAARKAHVRALAAMQSGRLVPREQLPLPDQTPTLTPDALHSQPCREISSRGDSEVRITDRGPDLMTAARPHFTLEQIAVAEQCLEALLQERYGIARLTSQIRVLHKSGVGKEEICAALRAAGLRISAREIDMIDLALAGPDLNQDFTSP